MSNDKDYVERKRSSVPKGIKPRLSDRSMWTVDVGYNLIVGS